MPQLWQGRASKAVDSRFTCLFIYHCHTIYNADGIKGAGFHALAKAQTAMITGFRSAVGNLFYHMTGLLTDIVVINPCLVAGTGTFYICNHMDSFTCVFSHNASNLGSYRSASHRQAPTSASPLAMAQPDRNIRRIRSLHSYFPEAHQGSPLLFHRLPPQISCRTLQGRHR